ncbi:DUF5979 domain-containing protein [Mediterraneibacter faecis]|uniref:DUF7601 domain-containing protein n=1 Tax=Mediterraneibacter faecis TaxID=592978 RepID=UPI001D020E24|nr:DUF5979 domain-containing protein [Mediterraneibacter faecis]MCB5572393.1 DUF5979 domain-containing protein [Mediterraneibacter faecis]MCB5575481.1 DUF5979 domain-containing protein [Mediterraneibacter faecis]MCB5742213.1 DUF5979 domain-containing protein [Mediterraneibacter faecis]MCB5753158.1 DUF5979 domain-containing protein [Mediterraneibacter faecis]
MRHNKWNKCLKIACSWILIFSMCFLSLNTVNASAEDTNAFESESEETKQETEKQIPDSIEVEQLNAEIQNRVANGEVPSTDRVKYVDEDGKMIEGAPTTIELGKISDHTEITIADKNYEFKNAKVSDEDCVFIGQYENYIYYSTDGNIAKKLTDEQLLVMTYSESKNSVNEEIEQVATEDTNKSEESTEQIIDNEGGTEQPEELNVPESISVQSLDEALQISVANGDENATSTDRVEYVDVNGNPIAGAPSVIQFGAIADHKDLSIEGRHFEFKSAKVDGKNCVYIGKYNDTVYYSTDGVIAIKLDDGQKLTMTYQEYYNIKVNEEIPEGGVAGTITTKAGTVKVNTAETIRVNAGETWKFTVKPGTANKVRYKIGSVKGADTSTSIKRVSGDEYEAYYEANFQKDDTVTIAYDKEGVYRVTINRTASDGTEYLNEEHSKKALDFTFTERELDADGAIDIPVIHTKRGYRLINMAINGTTLAETTDNHREIPTEKGDGHGITMDANCGDTSYLVTVVMEDSFTLHIGDEKDCSYAYSIKIKLRRGNWQDINLNLVPYKTGQQVLTVKLYTGSGHRSGDGLDVAMWNPDTKKLDPIHDSDTVNMDSVGSLAETLHKRQVRIFFAKSKNGYYSPDGAFKAFANEASPGGRVIAETGKVYQLSATTMGKTGTLEIYDEIWQEAKNAAQAAGYTEYVAFAGEKTLNTDWEMYVVSFTTAGINYYVHYKSGAGDGVIPDDAEVSNVPDNQELYNNRPMHSYGNNPSTAKGGRKIGVSFTVGEGNEEPTCSGYEFLGWKLQKKDGTLSSETYQNNDVFTVSEDNVEYADNTNLPFCSRNNEDGYQFVAQWKKISTKGVVVNHYLKVPNGTVVLKKTTPGTISFAENNETVTALATPEPAGTFSGYVFDKSDPRNNLEKAVTNDKSTDTIELNLYYKPTVLTVRKTVTGYNMEPNRSYEFTIKAVPPSGTDASTATITAGQIFIKKGTDAVKNLTFTNNQATFTLAKDESVDISCLPTGWTYIVTETNPGNIYKTSYKLNGSDATDGRVAEIITSTTGNDEVTFTNASTVAPPETGRTFYDSEWILLLIVILVISAGGMTFLRKMKKRY